MKKALVFLVAAIGLAESPVKVVKQAAPEKALIFEVEVPGGRAEVWKALVERSVLVRDTSSWPGLEGCLRVTVGLPTENDRFLSALNESLR